jgi:hypothetical protein
MQRLRLVVDKRGEEAPRFATNEEVHIVENQDEVL